VATINPSSLTATIAAEELQTGRIDRYRQMERSLLLAHIISIVCLPPFIAIGTLVALSSHFIGDPGRAARVAGVSSFFIAVAPCVYVAYLLRRNKISGGVDLVLKEERLRPYLVGAGSCLLGLLLLAWLSAPQSVTVLALCYALNALIMAVITQRWKISAHAAGAAMPLTALFSVFGAAALPFAVIIPVVCWARVKAEMHTIAQVLAGTLLGCLMTWLMFTLLGLHF
jgi:membrane-associated phospholipid phosphatase